MHGLRFFAQELQYDDNGSLDSTVWPKYFGQNRLFPPPFHHPPNPEISYFVPDFPKKISQTHKYLKEATKVLKFLF